jgi:glucose-1-phosphate adenylyltransferase
MPDNGHLRGEEVGVRLSAASQTAGAPSTAAIERERLLHRATDDTIALVLAGGRGSRLKELTEHRSKPSLYFGGKYRVVDVALSNCINSGLRRIAVLMH